MYTSHIHWVVQGTGLEHLKIETRLIDERFESVMGECDLEDEEIGVLSIFTVMHNAKALVRMLSTLDLR
jgi:hypothetical protein